MIDIETKTWSLPTIDALGNIACAFWDTPLGDLPITGIARIDQVGFLFFVTTKPDTPLPRARLME